jgi:CRP-like cAMP-binding protein
MCLQDTNKWVAIGAVLSGQARASMLGQAWMGQLAQLADASTDSDVLNTVGHALGMETFESHRALSLTDIILFLKRIPLYGSMTLDQLRTIAAHLTERDMSRGTIIFHEGDCNQELYLIVSGKVDIVKHFGATPRTLATLQAGDFFGEMAIFEDRPRSADAVGAEQGILLVLSPERFRQVVLQDPAISFEIFRILSFRIRRFDEETMGAARSLEAH